MTDYATRAPDVEAQQMADDLLAITRMLVRMRADLQRHKAWPHVEAACAELCHARTQIKLQRGPT